MTYQEIKEAYKNFMASKIGVEIKSAIMTFTGIFVGTITLSPVFNSLIGTDLPTIKELKDIAPVAIDAAYRSVWVTFLVETGLIQYRKK